MIILKKYQFWLSVIFAIAFFVTLCPLSLSPMAYYILGFVLLSVIGFSMVLYHILTKSFSHTNTTRLLWFTVLTALPHTVFSLLAYGSWICLCLSIMMIIFLLLEQKKHPKNE